MRSLKGAARRKLAKDRAPTLWILLADVDFRRSHCSDCPKANLRGLPAELRYDILLLSFSVQMLVLKETYYQSRRYRDKPRDFRAKRKCVRYRSSAQTTLTSECCTGQTTESPSYASLIVSSATTCRTLVDSGKEPSSPLQTRSSIPTLSKTSSPSPSLSPRMRVSEERVRSFMKGEKRPLKGKRPAKCWYCTEQHDTSRCTRAIEDPQKWFQDTKQVRGWRHRAQAKMPFRFQAKWIVSSD